MNKFRPLGVKITAQIFAIILSLVSFVNGGSQSQLGPADYAIFAQIAYEKGDAFIGIKKTQQDAQNDLVGQINNLKEKGWSQIDQSGLGEVHNWISGLDAHSYVNDNSKEIVVSFAGTRPTRLNDLIADAANHINEVPDQYLDALEYAARVQSEYPGYTITFTGHSLGGAIAAFVGLELDVPVVSFNPDYLGSWIEDYSGRFANPPPEITQYVRKGEFASGGSELQNILGGDLSNPYTKQFILDYPVDKKWWAPDSVEKHLMDPMLKALNNYDLEDITVNDAPGNTVAGGCFGNVPLVNGRVPTFLDGLGQVADRAEGIKGDVKTINKGIEAARQVDAISRKLQEQFAAFDKFKAGLGKYTPVVDKIFKGIDLLGKVCDVSTRLLNGYTALATGDKDAFVDLVNQSVRDAVVYAAKRLGSTLGKYIGKIGGGLIGGGVASPLTSFVGGWLGGKAGKWVGEKFGEALYDKVFADWVKNNIAARLFDYMCPSRSSGSSRDGTSEGVVAGVDPRSGDSLGNLDPRLPGNPDATDPESGSGEMPPPPAPGDEGQTVIITKPGRNGGHGTTTPAYKSKLGDFGE